MSVSENSLLQHFIPEARDLLEDAGRSLLALEREPGGAAPMNALFRAVHTLKGTSGLFEIPSLTGVVHAAEDLLSAVQAGRVAFTAETADALLGVLDQVGAWVGCLEQNGDLPDSAPAAAAEWVARLRAPLQAPAAKASTGPESGIATALPAWLAALASADVQSISRTAGDEPGGLLAISFTPDPNCFFRGEDPVALMRQIDGLLLLRIEPVAPWPLLDQIDPFLCNLRIHAVAAATAAEVEHHVRYVRDQVEMCSLPAGWPGAAVDAPRHIDAAETAVQRILDSQILLLRAAGPTSLWPGRLAAATRALHGVIRFAGRDRDAAALDAAAAQAASAEDPAPLLAFIAKMSGRPVSIGKSEVESARAPAADIRAVAAPTVLRVEQSKIDAMMNLIGELVVAKNGLAYLARRADDGSLTVRELAREIKERQTLVERIVEEMQTGIMAIRTLPAEHVFQRFPRLVRDTARRLGKRVELVMEGGDTEADKNVIEAIADPLIHMVRNSLDHGIETPDQRVAAGKPGHGTIRLTAAHEDDQLVIRVIDDGRGVDPEAVRRKALEKGLISPERAAAMSDDEASMLIFAPGFSTAATISDLSGRGVGMDVVRSTVEKAGGQVRLNSRFGVGTTVELLLPLSMAVTRLMTVACGSRMFGVPMALVMETVRVPRQALYQFRDRQAFVLRESVVPAVRLAQLLDLPEGHEATDEEAILVARINGERLGIIVGAFREGMEAIVKPMEGVLAGLRGFAGTTLLGDGRVLLVLNLPELVA